MSRGSLPLDIKTRWNSTYLMLQRAIKFKVAFDKMEMEDRLYNDYFNEVENGNKRIGPPATVDWNAVERLVKFLVIFYNSTLVVSASTTVCSHKCYGEIVTIESNLSRLSTSLDRELRTKADGMRAKFDKYWGGMKYFNKMVIVASVFDPTKKMQFAKLCFEKLYGKETPEAKAMYQSVHTLLTDMFKEYSLRLRRDATGGQSSQSTQASSSNVQDQDQELGENMEDSMDLVDDLCYERMDFAYTELVAEIGVEDARDELELYLKEKVENPKNFLGTEYDVLSWWRLNCHKYPILAEMAKDVLAMQVSSVAAESAFSTSGRLVDPFRSCLSHFMIEVLM
ncbi:zinc finger BED domain-containing protein RICESLEEPER 2-like [Raphanus sativus]|uniref:Zinc finger BED domain-containing protein RICESLEEPER 2-like n=1 Tax=Raphanus sativus TaxID=3726 RepID=A0A6J0JLE3_RAPSA|nr:zinc finger BED domain-containing protein RICESLEEPER 2-like [Raphanus sativus]